MHLDTVRSRSNRKKKKGSSDNNISVSSLFNIAKEALKKGVNVSNN